MIMKDSGEVKTNEEFENDLMSYIEDDNEKLSHDGDLLVVRRVLNRQEKEKDKAQRENIFHNRCLSQGKMCSMIIDGGSCINVASTILMGSIVIGKYKDELLCVFDGKVTHNWYTNSFCFIHNEMKITLAHLSSKQVFEDQIK
ncbi:hypothetical protein CR513_24259, partial [Mucuna pruriens]